MGQLEHAEMGFQRCRGWPRHRNATHPLFPPTQQLPSSPPLGDMESDFGGLGTNTHDDNHWHGGMSPMHDGQNSPGPQQEIPGGARTLCHPILNSKSSIAPFCLFINGAFSRHAM